VIRHQTVRVHLDAEATDRLPHDVEEETAILVVPEGELMIGSSVHHMVHSTVEVDSKWSCHWKIALLWSGGHICRDAHEQHRRTCGPCTWVQVGQVGSVSNLNDCRRLEV